MTTPNPNTTLPPPLPSDRQLVDAARVGHDAAWSELLSRHEPAIIAILRPRTPRARRGIVRALEDLRSHLAEESAVGEPAVRAFRPRALARITGGGYGPVPVGGDASGSAGTDDQFLIAAAFGRLPEPWQTVLWHTHVEHQSPATVSPLVGRSVRDVGELLATAERGLADAFLQEYADNVAGDEETASLVTMLGGYVRSSLAPTEQRLVDQHLQSDSPLPSGHTSEDSRRLMAVASSLPSALAAAVAPGVTGLSDQRLRRALGTMQRPFGPESVLETKSDRPRRILLIGTAVTVVIATIAALFVLRRPDDAADPSAESSTTPEATAAVDTTVASTPGSTPGATETTTETTTTTTLDLRPSGPPNEITLVLNEGSRAESLGTLELELLTTVTAPAPVFAGGTGTLDISVANSTADPIAANLELILPSGMSFERLVGGDVSCADPENDSPYCDIVVEPNSTRDLSVRLRLESRVVGRLLVDGQSVVSPVETQIAAVSNLVHNSVGRGDVVMIGNTLMSCGDEPDTAEFSCADVRAGTGDIVDRWDVPMKFIGQTPDFGFSNSSQATLELPEGAQVQAAYLFWAGDLAEAGNAVTPNGQSAATMATPTGEYVGVEAAETRYGEEDATQYLSHADVTSIVAAAGGGEYTFGNIASVESKGSFGAWSLIVVTDDDTLPRRQRIVLDPFAWTAPQNAFVYGAQIPTPVLAGASARLNLLGFEGERGLGGESLVVAGAPIGGDNPFDSSITGQRTPSFDNNLGVDIDAYDLVIDTPAGFLNLDATSTGDGVRIAVLGITVDLAT